MPQASFNPPWFVRKDLDGFFGLMIDNLIQLILIVSLCRELIHLPDELHFWQDSSRRGDFDSGRQLFLRLAGAPTGARNGTRRRDRAALRHQHGQPLRFCFFYHVADRSRDQRSGLGLESRTGRLFFEWRDRNLRCLYRRERAPRHAARGVALRIVRHRDYFHRHGFYLQDFRPAAGSAGADGVDLRRLLLPSKIAARFARRHGGHRHRHFARLDAGYDERPVRLRPAIRSRCRFFRAARFGKRSRIRRFSIISR